MAIWRRQAADRGRGPSKHRTWDSCVGVETQAFLCLQSGESWGQLMGSFACWVIILQAAGSYGWFLSWGAAAVG